VVLSKGELLAAAWPQEGADEHAVEVAVARLRRRLGPRGHLLETVLRRGYRLAA
jgi:uroporphyrinogen-III synthase